MNPACFQSLSFTNAMFIDWNETSESPTNNITPVVVAGVVRVHDDQPLLLALTESPARQHLSLQVHLCVPLVSPNI